MLSPSSSEWIKFTNHVLKWEGHTSHDPKDASAAACVVPGTIHTVYGVTFCTYKSLASSFGLDPSYNSFLNLQKNRVPQFLYRYYHDVSGKNFKDAIALSMTEVAWGSGPVTAIKTLQRAVNDLGGNLKVDGIVGPLTTGAANSLNQKELYQKFWVLRSAWLKQLSNYEVYKRGWTNRINDFLSNFPAKPVVAFGTLLFFGSLLFFLINRQTARGI